MKSIKVSQHGPGNATGLVPPVSGETPEGDSASPRQYSTIYADPPWPHQQKGGRGASRHYPLMTLQEIRDMPVADLAAENSHAWLWCTNASLRDAFDVVEAWGFTPRSVLTWAKWPRLGLGVYLRNATEHVIFATRGKAPVRFRSQPSWFTAPTQAHSQKPNETYAIIERVSSGPFLELFARRRPLSSSDWSIWGNEVASDVVIPGYPVPTYTPRACASPATGAEPIGAPATVTTTAGQDLEPAEAA